MHREMERGLGGSQLHAPARSHLHATHSMLNLANARKYTAYTTWDEQVQRVRMEEPIERTIPLQQVKAGEVEKLCANDEWQVE